MTSCNVCFRDILGLDSYNEQVMGLNFMFGQGNKKKSEKVEEGLAKKSARGNMDEYEALRTIVAENPGLLLRVLEKIRMQRTLSGTSSTTVAPKKEVPKSGPKEEN